MRGGVEKTTRQCAWDSDILRGPTNQWLHICIFHPSRYTEGSKGGVVIPFHEQILPKFTRHVDSKRNSRVTNLNRDKPQVFTSSCIKNKGVKKQRSWSRLRKSLRMFIGSETIIIKIFMCYHLSHDVVLRSTWWCFECFADIHEWNLNEVSFTTITKTEANTSNYKGNYNVRSITYSVFSTT